MSNKVNVQFFEIHINFIIITCPHGTMGYIPVYKAATVSLQRECMNF